MFKWFKNLFSSNTQIEPRKEHDRQKTGRIFKELFEKYRDGKYECRFCKHNILEVGDPWHLQTYNEGMLIGRAPVMPIISVSCSNCSHIEFFGAIPLGIIDNNGRYT